MGHESSYYKTGNFSEMEVFAHSITLAKVENKYINADPILTKLTEAMKQYGLNILK